MFKKIRDLEKRVEDLEKVIPKLYRIMVKSLPNLPCGHFKECMCNKCDYVACIYNPNTTVTKTFENIISDILHA
jgi:hypothetical protein